MRVHAAIAVMILLGCGHTNGFYGDRMGRPTAIESNACAEMPCGGSGDALQITVGAALLAGLVVAKLWRH